jgi:multimeric flavodoxin WrbA
MHDDDMMAIRKALSDSDLVVFSSPVHFNHVSSSFQNFVERSLVDLHVFEYVGRPFVNIISTNGSGEGDVDKYMTRIGILFGMVRLGMCYTSKNDEFDQRGFLRLIDKTKSILQDRRLRPTVVNSLYFNSMKKIILKNSTFFEYEKKVWMERGWFEKSFKQIFNEKRQI